ncbi:MSC_0882 family membrane protein [Mesoplasma photuris]|uniref:MSC_0882 family membrane protein n=1 Tax=Mesoplasma photuris TaxID=217731 RepID=UPI00068BC85A|nr:hypothetical protein [Mesoplasma photuris]
MENNYELNPTHDQTELNSAQVGFAKNQRLAKPNFDKKELDSVKIPREIAKEIKLEKFRIFGISLVAFICLSVSLFFVILSYTAKDGKNFLNIDPKYVPSPIGMFFLMGFGIVILALAMIDFSHIVKDVKKYKSDLIMGVETIPYFIRRNYKSLITRPIYTNWTAFFIYIFGGASIGITYAINTLNINDTNVLFGKLNTEIIIMIAIEIITLIMHVGSLILVRYRKGNINTYYGYEPIEIEEAKDLRKRASRTCIILFFGFLAIVLFFIIIPYMIVRKKKGKSIIPFI